MLNFFFVAWGAVALLRYLQDHDVSALELSFVGLLTGIVGFVLPWLVLFLVAREIRRLRKELESRAMAAVAVWLEGLKSSNEDLIKNPLFWTKLGLAVAEALLRDVRHPAALIFTELAPVLRSEIGKRLHPSHPQ